MASLDERLRKAQAEEAERTGGQDRSAGSHYRNPAYRVLSVLIAYPAGCAAIGFAIDAFAGTHGVWVVMLFLGFGLAMWEVWKLSKQSPH